MRVSGSGVPTAASQYKPPLGTNLGTVAWSELEDKKRSRLVRPERPYEAGPGYWLLFDGREHVTAVEERRPPVEGTPEAANWSIRTTQLHERNVTSGSSTCLAWKSR